VTNVIHKN